MSRSSCSVWYWTARPSARPSGPRPARRPARTRAPLDRGPCTPPEQPPLCSVAHAGTPLPVPRKRHHPHDEEKEPAPHRHRRGRRPRRHRRQRLRCRQDRQQVQRRLLRLGDHRRPVLGGRRGQRGRRQVRPGERARHQGQADPARRVGRVRRAQQRQGRRHPGGLGRRAEEGQAVRRRQEVRGQGGRPRRDRPHRLVHPEVPGREAPGHHRLQEPQQVRGRVQDRGERRQGPAARGLAVVHHQRRRPHQEPGPEPQDRLRRFRGRPDHPDQGGLQGQEAVHQLLVDAAVAELPDRPGRGEAAGVQGRLRRRHRQGEVRLRQDPAAEVPGRRLRQEQREGRGVPEELQLDQRAAERGRGDDRGQEDELGQGRGEVGQGQPGRLEGLAAEVTARDAARGHGPGPLTSPTGRVTPGPARFAPVSGRRTPAARRSPRAGAPART